MERFVYMTSGLVPAAEASIPIYDHAFLYGDGVFEGIRVYERRIFKLDEHVARLFRGAHALAMKLHMTPAELREAILETARANEVTSGYIRVSVSRGTGLGLDPSHIDASSRVVISTAQLRLYTAESYDRGLEVITASTRVPPPSVIDPQIKSHGRYINNILAKLEAIRVGAGEALMLNMDGYVAEATGDNLFLVVGDELITPPTSQGALPGITRLTVMGCARAMGIPVREAVVTLFDCYNADEAFLTGTAAEAIAMVRLDDRDIANGKPGAMTLRLMDAFRSCTRAEGAPL